MAKALGFQFGDEELWLILNKVERGRLYGYKEVEAVDEHDELCDLATLADDGRTLIGRGGTAFVWLDVDGNWCDKAKLKPINVLGDEITPVASSFNESIQLFNTATVEEYLQHNIRLVYALTPADAAGADSPAFAALLRELQRGTIFSFEYSYRGGLEADAGFLILSEQGEIMLAVGNSTETPFVGLQSQIAVNDDDSLPEDEAELMDFDMI